MATTQATTSVTRFDPSRVLKADHREVDRLLKRLGKSEEGPQRVAMLDELESKLALHMQLEETMVYPMVAQLVGAEDEEPGTCRTVARSIHPALRSTSGYTC